MMETRRTRTTGQVLKVLLLAAFMFASTQASACETVTAIEGKYQCAGECVVTDFDGNRKLIQVSGETDTVERFPKARQELYQVSIVGDGGFRELEIGALVGLTLRAATAEVSNGQFPVLEEYFFETDQACKARGFTKVVRNPSARHFKSCLLRCEKQLSKVDDGSR